MFSPYFFVKKVMGFCKIEVFPPTFWFKMSWEFCEIDVFPLHFLKGNKGTPSAISKKEPGHPAGFPVDCILCQIWLLA